MKKYWLLTILSFIALLTVPVVVAKNAQALPACPSPLENPPAYQQDCAKPGYWLRYCGTNGVYEQFDRCANESFYLKRQQRIGFLDVARWIWQFGHDGTRGQQDISSANGNNSTDMSGFVNVIRDNLFGAKAGIGYTYISTGINGNGCNETTHNAPDGTSYNSFQWCEIHVAALVGASQMVNNMLGMGGDNPAFSSLSAFRNYCSSSVPFSASDKRLNGINVARCRFFEWWSLVNYYASQSPGSPNGWINWNEQIPYNNGDCRTDAVVYRDEVGLGISDPDVLDTGSYINCAEDHNSRFIVFYNPGGVPAFRINKFCGNLTGPLRALQITGRFEITPQPSPPELKPSPENPNSAEFKSSYLLSSDMSGTNITSTVTRSYYIDKYNSGTNIALRPNIVTTISGAELTAGQHDLSDETFNNLRSIDPTLAVGDKVCQTMTINPGAGNYNFSSQSLSSPSSRSATQCDTVQNWPYVKFFGGDVYAGGAFNGSGESCDAQSNIITYNSDDHSGSSAQFAVTALGYVVGITSANLGSSGTNVPPNGLTFANDLFDGVFGGSQCYTDYWSTAPATANIGTNTVDISSALASGAYKRNGNLKITAGGSIGNGLRRVIYVDGNVLIQNNIDYSPSFTSGGGLASERDIPVLIVVATGNIYISSEVNRLSGIFIAQGSSAPDTGNIYTCSRTGLFNPYPAPSGSTNAGPFLPSGACNNRLTVYGAFIAKTIKFLRTANSVRNSSPTENYSNSNAAETFILSPELYVAAGVLCSTVPGICSSGGYDSITSLSPVL